jgi:hypothetical protein
VARKVSSNPYIPLYDRYPDDRDDVETGRAASPHGLCYLNCDFKTAKNQLKWYDSEKNEIK